MEFGEWLQKTRKEQNLDARAFAQKTGIDSSTVSRTENKLTQTSIYTAFRICEGLGVSAYELAGALTDNTFSELIYEQNSIFKDDLIPSLNEIADFVAFFQSDKGKGVEHLLKTLNTLSEEMTVRRARRRYRTYHIPISVSDIDRLLLRTELFQPLEIDYPLAISSETLVHVYEQRGALMVSDVEAYAYRLRMKAKAHLPLGSLRTLGRMGSGSILERTKLSDVFDFDIQTKQQGRIIGMYWEACRFYSTFSAMQEEARYVAPSLFSIKSSLSDEPGDWVIRLAMIYLVTFRWRQVL